MAIGSNEIQIIPYKTQQDILTFNQYKIYPIKDKKPEEEIKQEESIYRKKETIDPMRNQAYSFMSEGWIYPPEEENNKIKKEAVYGIILN